MHGLSNTKCWWGLLKWSDADCSTVYVIETDDEELIKKLLKLKGRKRLLVEIYDEKTYAALVRHYKDRIRTYKVEKGLNQGVHFDYLSFLFT